MRAILIGLLMSCFLLAPMVPAAIVWDESSSGDLSSDWTDPNDLNFLPGSNIVQGATGSLTAPSQRDYFTFTIPVGYRLASIIALDVNFDRVGGSGFLAIQSGSTVTDPSTAFPALAASLLGYKHYVAADEGNDILPAIAGSNIPPPAFPFPAMGFTSLGAGTYSVWIQDTSPGNLPYAFEFNLETPEPGTWATGLAGLLGMAFLRRKR